VFFSLTVLLSFGASRAQARDFDFSLPARDANDARTLAPLQPDSEDRIAQPQTGHDLGSVTSDWARRQIHLSTNGADEKFLNATNKHLDALISPNENVNVNGNSNIPTSNVSPRSPASLLRPHSLHMSRVGEFEMGFSGKTKITYDLVNGSELTLSKPLLQDIDIRLHHESTMNTLQLRISW